jgi:hypothetical protein
VQNPLTVNKYHLARVNAGRLYHAEDADVCRAGAEMHYLYVAQLAASEPARVHKTRQRHSRRALLVIVPYRDAALGTQRVQDSEAVGLLDVFEVEPPVGRLEQLAELDELVRVFRVHTNRVSVHATQVLEKQRLALHHGQAGLGPDVSEAQDAGAVRDHRYPVALVGVDKHLFRVGLYLAARRRNTRRVPDGEVVEIADTALGHHLRLAPVKWMKLERVLGRLVSPGSTLILLTHDAPPSNQG